MEGNIIYLKYLVTQSWQRKSREISVKIWYFQIRTNPSVHLINQVYWKITQA